MKDNNNQDSRPNNSLELLDDAYVNKRVRQIEEYVSSNTDHHAALAWYRDTHKISKLKLGFEQLKTLSRDHGFKVSVVIIPFLREHVDAHVAAYDIVRYEAYQNGFDVIEPLPSFINADVTRLKILPRDSIHPNELGHRLIADALSEFYLHGPNERIPLN